MKQKELQELLNDLNIEDRYSILFEVVCLQARAALKGIVLRNGRCEMIRMMVIYGAVLPISLWIHQPTTYEPHWFLLKAWCWAMIAMLGLYKLLPI